MNNPRVLTPDLDIYGLWAYDSAIALAMAAEEASIRNPRYLEANISRNSTDLKAFGVSDTGPQLIQALSTITFKGLAGNFRLIDGQLQAPPFQIINMVGPGARGIGYWTKENGIVKELNFTPANTNTYSTSKSNLGSIIWPGDASSSPKGWVVPTNGKKLRVGVPYGVPYEYIPYATPDHKMAGDYDSLTYQVYTGKYDAVAGDVTIVANRSQYVDFTLPYKESGIQMIVPILDDKSRNTWLFVKPLTWELWLASFCSFVFIGVLIWILEHRINEDFRGPFWYQVGMIFWFAFSTMVFAHKERIISNLARFVLIIWFLVVLILTQSYTASLASLLTVQKLQPKIRDINVLIRNKENVGYMKGSFIHGFLKNKFDESHLKEYDSPEKLDELMSKGGNDGISAAFHETPYIRLFLGKYCSKYTTVGPIYKADGFGFVFPIGSPLVPDVSRAILSVTESPNMLKIENKWLGDKNKCPDSDTIYPFKSLGLASFWGLFLIVVVAGIAAFIIYLIRFLRENQSVIERSAAESTMWSKTLELIRRFDKKDLSSHTFKKYRQSERDDDNYDDSIGSAMHSPHRNYQQSPSSFSQPSPRTNGPPSPVFSIPPEHNINSQQDQGLSAEYATTSQIGGSVEMINQETANLNANERITST